MCPIPVHGHIRNILARRANQPQIHFHRPGGNFPNFKTRSGKTVCTNDFYEGQARLDGAFCSYTESQKMEYLQWLKENGVSNIEMESTCFAALTHMGGIKSAIVCVALLDRLNEDQVCI